MYNVLLNTTAAKAVCG